MSKFEDVVTQETPRFIVLYKCDREIDLFQWGVIGDIPILSLLGAIVRVQAELTFKASEPCPECAFVIAWDAATKTTRWFVHPSVPVDALVGMMETIKVSIITAQQAKKAQVQVTPIIGPDGRPVSRVIRPS